MNLFRCVLAMCAATCLTLAISCGGGSNSNTTTTTPAPNPGTSNTGSGSPGGSSGGAASATTPDNFSAQMLEIVGRNSFLLADGTVSVDASSNNGAGVLQYKGNAAGTPTETLQFCSYATGPQNCTDITTFTFNPAGNTVQFTMPKGTWSGVFQLSVGTAPYEVSGMSTTQTGLNFQSALLPASSVTAGVGSATGAETGSGTMSTSGATLQIKVQGAKANNSYTVQLCDLNRNCKALGSTTSNGSGAISASFNTGTWEAFNGIVALSDSVGIEYVSAFRSP